jgi:hypothetical protein
MKNGIYNNILKEDNVDFKPIIINYNPSMIFNLTVFNNILIIFYIYQEN